MASIPPMLYLIEAGRLPGPRLNVPGRRLFSAEDVEAILAALKQHPELIAVRAAPED